MSFVAVDVVRGQVVQMRFRMTVGPGTPVRIHPRSPNFSKIPRNFSLLRQFPFFRASQFFSLIGPRGKNKIDRKNRGEWWEPNPLDLSGIRYAS
jgi:hypothetical protein